MIKVIVTCTYTYIMLIQLHFCEVNALIVLCPYASASANSTRINWGCGYIIMYMYYYDHNYIARQ